MLVEFVWRVERCLNHVAGLVSSILSESLMGWRTECMSMASRSAERDVRRVEEGEEFRVYGEVLDWELDWELDVHLDLDLDLDADLDADWRMAFVTKLSRLRSISGVSEACASGGVDTGETVGCLGLEMGVRRTGCCGSVRRRFILLRI